MRSRSESSPTEGQRKPRRGREKPAKRWGQVSKIELETILADIADNAECLDEEGRAVALRFEAISRVAGALLEGARLSTDSHAACRISQANEPLRFACTRKLDGRVVEVFQAYDEGNIDDRGPYAITLRERDWSAFAAARAFVDYVGAERALMAVEERHRVPKPAKSRPALVAVAP